MLIDLEFSQKHYPTDGPSKITKFDTSNGGLTITVDFDLPNGSVKKDKKLIYAIREAKGIYWAAFLDQAIDLFTDWNVDLLWTIDNQKQLRDAFYALDEGPEKEAARLKYIRSLNINKDYGSADTIEQILKYGKRFILSEHPYVLQLLELTPEHDGGWRWHKNGPYIGRIKNRGEYLSDTPEIEKIITFHFYRLKEKDDK